MSEPAGSALLSRPREQTNSTAHLVLFLLCLFPLMTASFMSTDGLHNSVNLLGLNMPVRLPCLFKDVTGFNCPGCGMTRSFIYMSRFEVGAAASMNHAGVLLYFLCLYEVPYRLAYMLFGAIPFARFFTIVERVALVLICAVDVFYFFYQFRILF